MELKNIRGSLYSINKEGVVYSHRGKIISTWKENNTGYVLFRVRYADQTTKCFRLHRILAESFLPNPDNLKYVKHKNDNKEDNSLANLEWGSTPDNTQEGYDNGCYKYSARKHKVKTTCHETGAILIHESIRKLSDTLGLHRKNVSAVLKGHKTNNYPYDFEYWEM